MFPLIALNLLRLLSQNRLSDFHTALETIDPEQLQSNAYIKQAVDLGKHSPMVKYSCSLTYIFITRTILDGRQLQQGVEHKKDRSRRRIHVLL